MNGLSWTIGFFQVQGNLLPGPRETHSVRSHSNAKSGYHETWVKWKLWNCSRKSRRIKCWLPQRITRHITCKLQHPSILRMFSILLHRVSEIRGPSISDKERPPRWAIRWDGIIKQYISQSSIVIHLNKSHIILLLVEDDLELGTRLNTSYFWPTDQTASGRGIKCFDRNSTKTQEQNRLILWSTSDRWTYRWWPVCYLAQPRKIFWVLDNVWK